MLGREVGDGGRGFGVDREEQASGKQETDSSVTQTSRLVVSLRLGKKLLAGRGSLLHLLIDSLLTMADN